jgi:hypothetical protein
LEWPSPPPVEEFTNPIIRFKDQEAPRKVRRGFKRERILDWAEKKWNLMGPFHPAFLNGVDLGKFDTVPQKSVVDIVVQWNPESPS